MPEEKITIYDRLRNAQQELKAPKSESGRFGKHRNVEGILEALKPVLEKNELTLTLDNEVIQVGERIYVQAIARVYNGTDVVEAKAQAWEGELSRGLDAPQVTGSAGSYARKYALGGLFAIDDSKDPDSHMDEPGKAKAAAPKPAPTKPMALQKDTDPVTPLQKQQLKNAMAALDMDRDAMGLLINGALGKDTVDTYADFKTVLDFMKESD